MRATLLVRSRKETIATVTTNMRQYYTTVPQTDGMLVLVRMRATLLVRSRKETIAMVTTNIRQYYTTDPQTDGILVLVQDEGDTTREI
jgi:biotin-(acetyl-CoA carboxylase) ligase